MSYGENSVSGTSLYEVLPGPHYMETYLAPVIRRPTDTGFSLELYCRSPL